MNRFIKISLFLISGFILCTFGVLFFTQTKIFKSWLKDFAVEKSTDFLNTEIALEEIKGNFFSNLSLVGLKLKNETETLVKIDEISLSYDLSEILEKKIQIDFVKIESPFVSASQINDSTWNLQQILKPTEEEESDTTTSFDFDVVLDELKINSAKIEISTIDSTFAKIPRKIDNLNFVANASYISQKLELELQNLSFTTLEPDFNLALKTEVEQEKEKLKVNNFALKTDSTNLKTNLILEDFENPKFDFDFALNPLSLKDVKKIADSLNVFGSPKITLKVKGELENFAIDLSVKNFETELKLGGNLGIKNKDFQLDLSGTLRKLNLEKWLGEKDLKTNLNLDFSFNGKVPKGKNPNVKFDFQVLPSEILEQNILASNLSGELKNEELNFRSSVNHKAVKAKLNGKLGLKNPLSYSLKGDFTKIRIEEFVEDFAYKTNLNAKLNLNGSGTEPEKINANFGLSFYESTFENLPLGEIEILGNWKKEFLKLNELSVNLPFVKVSGKGGIGVEKRGSLNLEILLEDLQTLAKIDTALELEGNGKIDTKIQGVLDSVLVVGKLNFPKIKQTENEISDLTGNFEALISNSQTKAKLELETKKIKIGEIDSLEAKIFTSIQDAKGFVKVSASKNRLFDFETKTNFELEKEQVLEFEKLDFTFQENQNWTKGKNNPKIKISGTNVQIEDFVLKSDSQKVEIFGKVDSENQNNLKLKISNFDLAKAFQKVEELKDYSGFLDFGLDFTNTFSEPKINGKIDVFKNTYRTFALEELKGNFVANSNSAKFDFKINRTKSDSIFKILGFMPIEMSFSPFSFVVKEDDSLNIILKSKDLELGIFQGFTKELKDLNGTFSSEIKLSNSLKKLEGNGFVNIANTSFEIIELGNKYKNINILAKLKRRELSFEKFEVFAGKGSLKIVNGSLSIAKENEENFTTKIVAKKFPLIDTKKIKLVSEGQIEVSGSVQEILFGGNLVIPESKIYYSDLIPTDESLELTDAPFFVIGESREFLKPENAKKFQKGKVALESNEDFKKLIKKVKGNLKIELPRNTWLKSNEANIEVEGDLDLVKERNSENFLLYGTLNTVRGYYELQGNRFQIEEGELNFKGNPQINPDLNVYAINVFRNKTENGDFQQRELAVKITGNLEVPVLNFTLDGNEVEQKDVISILLFGQTFDQLSLSQRKGVSESSSQSGQVGSVITTQLLKGISSKISRELNLDIFEIEKGKSLQNSTVKVGKYLTPNVFVSVSQEFGSEDGQRVELEYKLPKKVVFLNLFLQAEKQRNGSSGLDLIWKYEW